MTAVHGLYNPKLNLINQGIEGFRNAYFNLTEPDLIAHSLMRKEGELGIGGTLLVKTGKFTAGPLKISILLSVRRPKTRYGGAQCKNVNRCF